MMAEDRDEVELLRCAFEDVGLPVAVDVATHPEDCLKRLRRYGRSPEVVLVDLDQSPVEGRRLLGTLKHDDHLRHVPVLFFTLGDDRSDVRDCYREHAAACVSKPVGMEQYRSMAEGLYTFWFEVAILPQDEDV